MLTAYFDFSTWVAIVIAGVAGCLASWLLAYAVARAPFRLIGGHPGKQLWAVIFAIPIPLLISLGGPALGPIIGFAWLTIAPSVGVRTVFPPSHKITNAQLLVGNSVYAFAALAVYLIAKALTG